MSVKVLIPKVLGRYLNGKSEIHVEASDLRATLEILSREYKLEDILLTRDGHLQTFIRVVIDERLVTSRKAEELGRVDVGGKTVEITAAFAGG